jgi:hypothetical protein
MNKALATPLALCLLLAAGTTQAQYLNMLGASPVSKFTDADTKLMMTAIDKALANPSDGVAQPEERCLAGQRRRDGARRYRRRAQVPRPARRQQLQALG